MDPAGIGLTTSRLRQLRQLPVVQHVHFMPLKLCITHDHDKLRMNIYIYQTMNSHRHSYHIDTHSSPLWVSYAVSFVNSLEGNDCVIKRVDYTYVAHGPFTEFYCIYIWYHVCYMFSTFLFIFQVSVTEIWSTVYQHCKVKKTPHHSNHENKTGCALCFHYQ